MKKISVLFAALAFALGCDNPKNATKEEKKIEVKMEKLSDTLVQATVKVNTTKEEKKISKNSFTKAMKKLYVQKLMHSPPRTLLQPWILKLKNNCKLA